MAHKTKVAVLRGGPSREYDVSLKTGESILSSLNLEKYQPVDIFIDKNGVWHIGGIAKEPYKALVDIDVVVNALHGEYGEDGKVQKILEDIGVPYTGSGVFSSAVAMNKHLTKEALKKSGIKLAHHKLLKKDDPLVGKLHELFRLIPNPSVIKPAGSGSSVGVSIVREFHDLEPALFKAFQAGDTVIIEEYIQGREATVGVIENFRGKKLYGLPAVEIIPPATDFFSYDAKYGGETKELCPSGFSEKTKKELERLAKLVHETLGLRHYSRSDFIVHPARGIYFLEVNTLPGLTRESLLPKSLAAIGVGLPEFLDHLVTIARENK